MNQNKQQNPEVSTWRVDLQAIEVEANQTVLASFHVRLADQNESRPLEAAQDEVHRYLFRPTSAYHSGNQDPQTFREFFRIPLDYTLGTPERLDRPGLDTPGFASTRGLVELHQISAAS